MSSTINNHAPIQITQLGVKLSFLVEHLHKSQPKPTWSHLVYPLLRHSQKNLHFQRKHLKYFINSNQNPSISLPVGGVLCRERSLSAQRLPRSDREKDCFVYSMCITLHVLTRTRKKLQLKFTQSSWHVDDAHMAFPYMSRYEQKYNTTIITESKAYFFFKRQRR